AEAAGFGPLHFGIRSAAVDHGLRLSLGARSDATSFNRDAHVRLLPPRAESLGEFLRRCRGSNPPAPTGQSVSNAYGNRIARCQLADSMRLRLRNRDPERPKRLAPPPPSWPSLTILPCCKSG